MKETRATYPKAMVTDTDIREEDGALPGGDECWLNEEASFVVVFHRFSKYVSCITRWIV
jgi:hypothetical protein